MEINSAKSRHSRENLGEMKNIISLTISKINMLVIEHIYFIWLFGLQIFSYYLLLILNPAKLLRPLVEGDRWYYLFVGFFLLQMLSTYIATLTSTFDVIRFLGIIHNLTVFLFLLLGYVFYQDLNQRDNLFNAIEKTLLLISITGIASFVYTLISGEAVWYRGIISYITGIDNFYTQVRFTQIGYLAGDIYPRVRILGTFPNTVSMLLLILSTLYYSNRNLTKSYTRKKIVLTLVVICLITTGARVGTLGGLIMLSLILINTRQALMLYCLVLLVALGFAWHLDFIGFAFNLRVGSTYGRFALYQQSINLMLETNLFTGLGLKPLLGGFPIGSHSSFIGYFVKNGIFTGLLFLIFQLFWLSRFFKSFAFSLAGKENVRNFVELALFNSILFQFWVDDLDVYELISFAFGFTIAHFLVCHKQTKSYPGHLPHANG